MKTLYESILDVDAQDRMERRASAHVNKKKLLADILDKLHIMISVLDFKYETSGSDVDPKHRFGLTENVISYYLEAEYDSSKNGDLLKKMKSGMRKTFMNYKYECDVILNDTKEDMYIFAPVGITISIGMSGQKTAQLVIRINRGDQDTMNQVNKFVEKFTTK